VLASLVEFGQSTETFTEVVAEIRISTSRSVACASGTDADRDVSVWVANAERRCRVELLHNEGVVREAAPRYARSSTHLSRATVWSGTRKQNHTPI
jgi:Tfp pilus assembly protein PilP